MEDLIRVALQRGVRTCLCSNMSDHCIGHLQRSEDGSDECFVVNTMSPVSAA